MYRVGIDLGGTNIVSGVVDEQYNIIAKARLKTNSNRGFEAVVHDMATTAKMALEMANVDISEVDAVGIGSPGAINSEKGIVNYAYNLGFKDVHLTEMLENELGVKTFLENDANAAAYGEFIAGAGKGTNDFILITLGTGVGGGMIINNKIFSGFNFVGAEIGHMVIVQDGEQCTCGRKGCWEAYASATALIRQTRAEMLENKSSVMWEIVKGNIDNVNGLTAFDGMRKGDISAKKVVDEYINYIATGVVNMVNIFQPEVFCIGGGICNEGETLLNPIIEKLNAENFGKNVEPKVKLKTATLGNDAGIIGAAYLFDMKK